ncbi:hypothetical protein TIFTF001_014513 [Ficus carica]|uniref:Endonuclease/exonuclease/phosphatase domain-containing protein n=1 Tax=Ficus carica TaxID=3494 RepID=A0AA88AG61_FICCA|nr:hypothetical protein TIFTF001_014513 [Ficus carica]
MTGRHIVRHRTKILVRLPCDTPVVDVEINPYVHVVRRQSPLPKVRQACVVVCERTAAEKTGEKLNLRLWYRKQISSSCQAEVHCSIHRDKLATLQCSSCVTLNLPVEESYYCSTSCFIKAWKKHRVSHDRAYETDRTTDEKTGRELGSCGSWHGNEFIMVEWLKVGSSKSYTPTSDDWGSILKLEVVAVDCSTGAPLAPVKVVETNAVITAPNCEPRCIIKCLLNGGNFDTKVHSSNNATFSVLSYNVLADVCATRERYSYCPTWALVWEYRRQKLVNEIIEYDADIICLQEVQSDHFESFYEPELTKHGYSVMYTKKTPVLYTANKFVTDGCATFYRRKLFKVIMKREDNVAHIAVLETLDSERFRDVPQSRICVANTHIHANSDSPDVKLFQVVRLVNVLEEIVQFHTPLLICGDLNSLPLSDPHRFIVSGRCDLVDNEIKEHLDIFNHLKMRHSLPLASAYASFSLSAGNEKPQQTMDTRAMEPLFTNFTKNFSGTLDYIFYTENSLRVEGLLNLLDRETLGPGLPSPVWPSDHIALMARFSLKPQPTRLGRQSLGSPPNSWQKTAARQVVYQQAAAAAGKFLFL